jgi:2-desacetyl-2-hydroxyethyl bacteriochlorophyllide A dehydrogenase
MRAVSLGGPRRVDVHEAPVPEPGSEDVLVRLEGCGVCGSNGPVWEGRPWFDYPLEPGAPGHEGWGVVSAVGPEVEDVAPGDRVAVLSGQAFAEYGVAPAGHTVRLPQELDGEPFPGEAIGCAVNIFRRSGVRAGQEVAIVGVGFLGALLVQLCAGAGARVTAFGRRPFTLELARSFGAERAFGLEEEPEASFETTIEAAGAQETLDLAGRLTGVRGRLVVAGYHQERRSVDMQLWNWRGLDVVNAHERDPAVYVEGMRRAADLVAAGELDPRPLYTHRLPLERAGDALDLMLARPEGFVKALVLA